MADRVTNAYLRTNADRKARLMDFDTGKQDLQAEHQVWLDGALAFISRTSGFFIDIVGYASNLGDANDNLKLSGRRAAEVAAYMQRRNNLVYPRIRYFEGRGTAGYTEDPKDDSADMRAVEVHIYIGDIEPPPPPNTDRRTRQIPPLPGAPRTTKWSVAAPGGATGSPIPGITIGFNIFFVRNEDTHELRGYIAPAGGAGFSYSGSASGALKIVKTVLTNLFGSPSFGDLNYTAIKPDFAFNWQELESSAVTVSSAGIGLIRGLAVCHITFEGPVTHYGSDDQPYKTIQRLITLDSAGKDWQFGVGGSAIAGPLIKLGSA